MSTTISIILVFGALIFFHELGHLLLAKRAGILCREFAIGFGPKLLSFKKNETLYTIRILPLGGYVRMAGEDPEVVEIKSGHDVGLIFDEQGLVTKLILNGKKEYPEARLINVRNVDLTHQLSIDGYVLQGEQEVIEHYQIHPQALMIYDKQEVQIAPFNRQFAGKTLGQRAATIFAGPAANFILAFVVLFGYALYNGAPEREPILGEVLQNSAAAEAGLQTGDRVLAIDQQGITTWDGMVEKISASPAQELQFTIERNGQQQSLAVTPATRENMLVEGAKEGFIGVARPISHSFVGSLQFGVERTVDYSLLIFTSLGKLITGGVPLEDLSGPIGIIDYTGQMAQRGVPILLQWTALISVNLAIFNLLPIPALDGGRLLFLAVEAVRGRPLDPHKEGLVHIVGFALLMLLILVVTWNDIQRVFLNN